MIVCGDFNCPDIDWSTHIVKPGASERQVQKELVDIAQSHSLTQLQEDPTRYKNTLDLTFSNNPTLIKSCTVIPGISDHDAIVIDSTVKPDYIQAKKRKVLQYKKANWEQLDDECKKLSTSIKASYDKGDCINTLWSIFKTSLTEAINKNIPSKQIRTSNNLPWMNSNLKKMIRKKNKLHQRAKKTQDWTAFRAYQKKLQASLSTR